jgi:hypothetical protein
MLGEKIGEEKGKVVLRRVLPNQGSPLTVEVTFQAEGTICGVAHKTVATYTSVMRPDGLMLGTGQGFASCAEGGATWVGQGVGSIKKDGSLSYRGAIFYQTTAAQWSRLNGIAAVFEYEVDPQGNTVAGLWEWK